MGARRILDIVVVKTVVDVETIVMPEVAVMDGGTGRGDPETGTSIPRVPDTAMTTIENVMVTAYLIEGEPIEHDATTNSAVLANVALPLTADSAAGQAVSICVGVPVSAVGVAAVAVVGSLDIGIERGDAGGEENSTGGGVALPGVRVGPSTAVTLPRVGEGWGRDAHMVEAIFPTIEGMDHLGLLSMYWRPWLHNFLPWIGKPCVWS